MRIVTICAVICVGTILAVSAYDLGREDGYRRGVTELDNALAALRSRPTPDQPPAATITGDCVIVGGSHHTNRCGR